MQIRDLLFPQTEQSLSAQQQSYGLSSLVLARLKLAMVFPSPGTQSMSTSLPTEQQLLQMRLTLHQLMLVSLQLQPLEQSLLVFGTAQM
jgi:hypothetical protein